MFYIDRETNEVMDEPADVFILYFKYYDMVNITGDRTYHILCCAINKIVSGQALDEQTIKRIWIIAVHNPQVIPFLLQSNITVNNKSQSL